MKKTTLIFLFLLLTSAMAEDRSLSKEEIELEKERLQIQRELIQLERDKLEVERLKLQHPVTAACPPQQPLPAAQKSPYTKDLYVGFDYIFYGSSRRTVTLNGSDTDTKGKTKGYGIKLGFGTPDENRVEIAYYKLRTVFDETYPDWDMAMLSLDYLFVYSEAFGDHLSPFIKIGLATATGESITDTVRAAGYTVSGESTISGSGLRLGFGIFYLLDERMEVALGLDSSGISWDKVTLTGGSSTEKIEIYDSVGTTYLTLNYRF